MFAHTGLPKLASPDLYFAFAVPGPFLLVGGLQGSTGDCSAICSSGWCVSLKVSRSCAAPEVCRPSGHCGDTTDGGFISRTPSLPEVPGGSV